MDTMINTDYRQDEMATAGAADRARAAGLAAIGGAIIMFIGAGLYFSSGTDLWAAVGGDMSGYLVAVGTVKAQLVANLTFWIAGVFVLGTTVSAMANLSDGSGLAVQIARLCAFTAVPLAILAFIAMLSLVVQIAPDASETSVALANVVGWIGVRADDLATALIVGFAPFFLVLAGRKVWAPGWLVGWGTLAGLVGLLSLVVLYIPPLAQMGFLIIPVGLGWMVAAGVVLLRHS